MMRKKQIFRMLVGALTVCMATACSNETDVLNGFPTDGNTLSINLRTNDIGATTRATIATEAESEVKSLSAYLFSKGESNEYKLEKIYNNLTWDNKATTHTVALTGIEERGPKKVYFVANGTGISALTSASANLPEADFQALLMNKMGNNPATPLAMTAQAELADWGEGVNNAVIQDAALLKRVSARVDLVVAPQEGLSFEPTSIALAAAANSYIFPNEEAYNGSKETIEISGFTLYPYETAAGTVKEVKVTGNVKVGETEKEATFVVPFVNKEGKEIAIERNHRYTVNIARINGFYSIEASITVSDWNAAGFSGDLEAGEELKMTATEYENEQLATAPAATAVYPTDETKTAVVELESTDAKVYKIYVGSANIEAVTSWTTLPDGWTMTEPADTRAEYLWEKSYWTLTIPANESDAKSLTVKAVNKLEQAKDQNTKKYVEITFTQKGKQGEVDHSKNPLLKWAESDLVRSGSGASVKATFASSYKNRGYYYQFGRNYGYQNASEAQNFYAINITSIPSSRNAYPLTGSTTPVTKYRESSISQYPNLFLIDKYFTGYSSANHQYDYKTIDNQTWYERAKSNGYTYTSPCPEGWRLPTKADFQEIMPLIDGKYGYRGSNAWDEDITQFKTLADGTKCAFRWTGLAVDNSFYALQIECLVVDQSVTDITSIDWEDEHVQSRFFRGSGYIMPVFNLWGNQTPSNQFVARPMSWGQYSYRQVGQTVVASQTADYMLYGGFYWTSDGSQSMFMMIFPGADYTLGYYMAGMINPIAANIRCVKE